MKLRFFQYCVSGNAEVEGVGNCISYHTHFLAPRSLFLFFYYFITLHSKTYPKPAWLSHSLKLQTALRFAFSSSLYPVIFVTQSKPY